MDSAFWHFGTFGTLGNLGHQLVLKLPLGGKYPLMGIACPTKKPYFCSQNR